MTSIVVTGGAGFVGLCSALRDQGAIATSIDIRSGGSTVNHRDGVRYVEAEAARVASTPVSVPDRIFRLGKYACLEQSFYDVSLAMKSNLVPRSSLPAHTECFKEELQARAAVK